MSTPLEGWRWVPVEATEEMTAAVSHNNVDLVRDGFHGGMAKLYRAMLAAAPSAPAPADTRTVTPDEHAALHRALIKSVKIIDEPTPAEVPMPEPYATLHHDDGCFTTKTRDDGKRPRPFRTDVVTLEQCTAYAAAREAAERERVRGVNEELAMMIRMLASSLKRHWPHAPQPGDLPSRAVDLLRRHELLGSPLREEPGDAAPKAARAELGEGR